MCFEVYKILTTVSVDVTAITEADLEIVEHCNSTHGT